MLACHFLKPRLPLGKQCNNIRCRQAVLAWLRRSEMNSFGRPFICDSELRWRFSRQLSLTDVSGEPLLDSIAHTRYLSRC